MQLQVPNAMHTSSSWLHVLGGEQSNFSACCQLLKLACQSRFIRVVNPAKGVADYHKSIDSFIIMMPNSLFSYLYHILQCQPSPNHHPRIMNLDLEILLIVDLLVPL